MCGRYVRRSDKQKLAEWFHAGGNLAGVSAGLKIDHIAPRKRCEVAD
jgi:hypothetical protein